MEERVPEEPITLAEAMRRLGFEPSGYVVFEGRRIPRFRTPSPSTP